MISRRASPKHLLLVTAALAALSLGGPSTAPAATWPEIALADLCRLSSDVVRGRVISSRAAFDANGIIFTTHELEVLERARPRSVTPSLLTFEQIGGQVGDSIRIVPGMPSFSVGDELVLFLGRGPTGRIMPLAGPRGALHVVDGAVPALPVLWPEAGTSDPSAFLDHVQAVINSLSHPR